jgi:hypothetical protein
MQAAPRTLALAAAGAVLLFSLSLALSFGLASRADVTRYSSGIYDMDVSRVVADVTTRRPPYRAGVHPLQKLLVAPLGELVNARLPAGSDRLAAAKLLIAAAMALQAVAAGWLAARLAGGSLAAGACALLLFAVSFASLLAATIPESAAFAGLGALAPLLWLELRWGRAFGWREALVWGALGAFCAAFTISQIAHWAIALGVRAGLAGGARAWARATLAAALAASLLVAGARLQAALYPPDPSYAESTLRTEIAFLRARDLSARPFAHAARVVRQVALDAFAAPRPAYSDFLMRDYGLDYWSLSAEEAGLAERSLALAAALLLAIGFAVRGLVRGADARLLAPALCVASQLALHLVYGRELVLYAPHWQGVLVALLVAGAWRGAGGRRRWLPLAALALAAALLANNLAVLARVHDEVAVGLDAKLRDVRGRPPAP